MTHIYHLRALGACKSSIEFASKYSTGQEAWDACELVNWLLWYGCHTGQRVAADQILRRAVLRAARSYAADACDRAGLPAKAAELRGISDDASYAEIRDICRSAAAYADAAVYAAVYAYAVDVAVDAEKTLQLADCKELLAYREDV